MKVLFLTIGRMGSIEDKGLYPDLLRYFKNEGHEVYTVSPYEKRTGLATALIEDNGAHMLHVSIGNITKCSIIEKGISTLQIESKFLKAIKKYFADAKFDLVMYSTPPITFAKVIKYVKKRDGAKTYLLLKDIFPQNAVDIGMMRKSGVKGILYRYFRRKEKKLYAISDRIGCMSQANVDYVLKHNPEVSPEKVEVSPNSIEIQDMTITEEARVEIRNKYNIPLDKKVFVYGGNLGRPQGIPFLMDCLRAEKNNENAYFLVVGDGTEYKKLEAFFEEEKPQNMKLLKRLPKEDYDVLVSACDVGMIFLDHRFTIPNFPSRLLAYLQSKLPVLAVTDPNTDIGKVITEGGFGWWSESNSTEDFSKEVEKALDSDLKEMGEKGFKYLEDNYTVAKQYEIIMGEYR
ncbi:MAG: glycosyltransferase family 4 protein [Clostridia bacterium]|nr:glycosyltransferase family 4 protein [Clostridia bacterium]